MTDSIDEEDVARIDEATDPTDLAEGAIEDELSQNPNLTGDAVDEFAERIAEKRAPVRNEGRELLSKRLSPNPANPEVIQLRTSDGRLGPRVPDEGSVDLEVTADGQVTAEVSGERVDLGTVDLNRGADGQRAISEYSRRQHPAQRQGGGGR